MSERVRSTAVEVGSRMPGGPLIEHALAIRAVAQADMQAFKSEGLLKDEDLAQVDPLMAEVHKGLEELCRWEPWAGSHTLPRSCAAG